MVVGFKYLHDLLILVYVGCLLFVCFSWIWCFVWTGLVVFGLILWFVFKFVCLVWFAACGGYLLGFMVICWLFGWLVDGFTCWGLFGFCCLFGCCGYYVCCDCLFCLGFWVWWISVFGLNFGGFVVWILCLGYLVCVFCGYLFDFYLLFNYVGWTLEFLIC